MSTNNNRIPLLVFQDGSINQPALSIPSQYVSDVFLETAEIGHARAYKEALNFLPYQYVQFLLNEKERRLHVPFHNLMTLQARDKFVGDGCEHPEMGGLSANVTTLRPCEWKHYSTNCNVSDCFRFDSDDAGVALPDGARVGATARSIAKAMYHDMLVNVVMGQFYDFNNLERNGNAGITPQYWALFQETLNKCEGHLAQTRSLPVPDTIIEVFEKKDATQAERTEALTAYFELVFNGASRPLDSIGVGVEYADGTRAMEYFNVSERVFNEVAKIALANSAKGMNGCDGVCNEFTSERLANGVKLLFYKEIPIYPETAKNRYDNHFLIDGKEVSLFDVTYTLAGNYAVAGRGDQVQMGQDIPVNLVSAVTGDPVAVAPSVYVAKKPGLGNTSYEFLGVISGGGAILEDSLAVRATAFVKKAQ